MKAHMHPEPLETRIAPATFLVSAVDLKAVDVGNPTLSAMDQANEINAAANVLVDFAFLAGATDKIFFDSNRNGTQEATDLLLVQIDAGNAMVFLNDRDGDGVFSPDELTGLAVSDGFKGVIKTDVAGSISTVLKPGTNEVLLTGGKFTLEAASIAKLDIEGVVTGTISAGNNITDVTAGKGVYAPFQNSSVNKVLSGTAQNGNTISFGGGAFSVNTFAPLGAGGNITDITLARGANTITAGAGLDGTTGNGANGGAITNVTISDAFEAIAITGGAGGLASASNLATGGTGGAVSGITIGGKVIAGNVSVKSGAGGASNGAAGGNGGDGGGVSGVAISFAQMFGNIDVVSGAGGAASNTVGGNGGASGSLAEVKIT